MGLGLTVLLGLSFTTFQVIEYSDAPFRLLRRRRLSGGVLPRDRLPRLPRDRRHLLPDRVLAPRPRRASSRRQRHFGFEAAAWYWHFVDVVWLFLFVAVYWWGQGVFVPGK